MPISTHGVAPRGYPPETQGSDIETVAALIMRSKREAETWKPILAKRPPIPVAPCPGADSPNARHHWVIEPGGEPTAWGECKWCHERREFQNWPGESAGVWASANAKRKKEKG